MDWGAWQTAAHGMAKSQRWLRTHTLLLNNSGEQIRSLCHASGVSKHVCPCSSRAESRLPTAILLVPPALQPAKGTCLSLVSDFRAAVGSAQYMTQTTHSPGRASTHVIPLLLHVPLQWHRL